MIEVETSADMAVAFRAVSPYLSADPASHNGILTWLDELRRSDGHAGNRAWWARRDSTVVGLCVISDLAGPCSVTAEDRPAASALAGSVAQAVAQLGGVRGEASASAAFAAAWTDLRRVPARAELANRLYVLDELLPAPAMPGQLRLADDDDCGLAVDWSVGFQRDAFGPGDVDVEALAAVMSDKVRQGLVWLWELDRPNKRPEPVAMTAATPVVAGVSRIQHVYTPPRHRRQGYAAACVSHVVAQRLEAGAGRCVLYADLANPSSNAIYQRLGFRPLREDVHFAFG